MTPAQTKKDISLSLQAFASGNLKANALKFFQTLGYITERQASLHKPNFTEFKETYINHKQFDETRAKTVEWKYIDLLFQLSKEEVLKQSSLFDTKQVDKTVIEAYLFFAIELSKDQYSRTELSLITRELNRLFPMPAMIYSNTVVHSPYLSSTAGYTRETKAKMSWRKSRRSKTSALKVLTEHTLKSCSTSPLTN